MDDRIRVLVVDDSAVMRRLLFDILSAEPDLDVQTPAASGASALARIETSSVDIMVLDVEMPDMSGLDVLKALSGRPSAPVVIMFSALTQRAAATTLDALALGAFDYVTKPSQTGSAAASVELVRAQLLHRIRVLGRRLPQRRTPSSVARNETERRPPPPAADSSIWPSNPPIQGGSAPASPSASFRRAPSGVVPAPRTPSGVWREPSASRHRSPEIVAIGASTGGPQALSSVLALLSPTLRVPIVIVQHMPPVFTRMLAERLTATTPIPVVEAVDGQRLEPGHAYLAPGDQHMVLQRLHPHVVIHLNRDPPEQSCRPSVDVLFRSVAATYSGQALAVVLTGMGQDGLVGCQALRAAGAQIVVQDEASSVVWGMPGFVARAGLADAVKPLPEISLEISRRLRDSTGGAAWP